MLGPTWRTLPPIGALFGPTDRSGPARADGKLWVCQIVGRTTRKSVSGAISIGANGAPEGSVGYIVEVYDDAYEVEVTELERAKRCSSEPFLTPTST